MTRRLRHAIRQRYAPIVVVRFRDPVTPAMAEQVRAALRRAVHPARLVIHDHQVDVQVTYPGGRQP